MNFVCDQSATQASASAKGEVASATYVSLRFYLSTDKTLGSHLLAACVSE